MSDWLYEYYRREDARRFGLALVPDREIDDGHYLALLEAVCHRACLDVDGDCLPVAADAAQWIDWITGRAERYEPDTAAWEQASLFTEG